MDRLSRAFVIAVVVIVLTSLLANSVAFHVWAQARLPVRNVDTGSDYATIQEALDAATTLNGHTILVEAGVYHENVVVDKSVSLVGEDKLNTIIDARSSGDVIKVTAGGVNITGFTIQNSEYGYSGVYIFNANGNNVSENIVTNDYDGIYVYGSRDNQILSNEVFGNRIGVHLYDSDNNNVSGTNAYENMNGIHLDISSNNSLDDNRVWSNTGNGIYLYSSDENNVSFNNVFSNAGRGIRLHYSSDNALYSNIVSGNGYGIALYGSADNVLSSNNASFNNGSGMLLQGSGGNSIIENILSYNMEGIWLTDSDRNLFSGNNVYSNTEHGARLWNSSSNVFFHNNMMKNLVRNVEQPSNISILNVWDDGAEGNYWDGYDMNATNINGIGDKPYLVDPQALGVYGRDSFPLMGQFFLFHTAAENVSYAVEVVSNSTVTGFHYDRGRDNKTSAMSFRVNGTNSTGFCLVCIPQFLIACPYTVTIDQESPLSYDVARTNGTHTWIYFTYPHSEHEIMIKPVLPTEAPIWHLWWFWGIIGLVLSEAILVFFAVKYRRKTAEQAKVLREYSPFVVAEALFKADTERRGLKIREFEQKYGVKIQPRATLEEVIRSLETKEKEKKS